jgi:hypothetical protein
VTQKDIMFNELLEYRVLILVISVGAGLLPMWDRLLFPIGFLGITLYFLPAFRFQKKPISENLIPMFAFVLKFEICLFLYMLSAEYLDPEGSDISINSYKAALILVPLLNLIYFVIMFSSVWFWKKILKVYRIQLNIIIYHLLFPVSVIAFGLGLFQDTKTTVGAGIIIVLTFIPLTLMYVGLLKESRIKKCDFAEFVLKYEHDRIHSSEEFVNYAREWKILARGSFIVFLFMYFSHFSYLKESFIECLMGIFIIFYIMFMMWIKRYNTFSLK